MVFSASHWRAELLRHQQAVHAEKLKHAIDVDRHSTALRSIEKNWPALEHTETVAIHDAFLSRMQESEQALRDLQQGVSKTFDISDKLTRLLNLALNELEKRDRIGALRQVAVACKEKMFRRVGGDRLQLFRKYVRPSSFKQLEEDYIRRACPRKEDQDYFVQRVQALKTDLGVRDFVVLYGTYRYCTEDLHEEFHQDYHKSLSADEIDAIARKHYKDQSEYDAWKELLELNKKMSADNGNESLFKTK